MSPSGVSVLTAKPLKRAGGGKGAGLDIEKWQLQSTCISWGLPVLQRAWRMAKRGENRGGRFSEMHFCCV